MREQKETATDKNEELHQRLEQMVDEVEGIVGDRKLPERSNAALEADNL